MADNMDVILERHEQHIKSLQHQVDDLKEVFGEIKSMNGTLITLTTEIKHTNENLARHDKKIDALESVPSKRFEQIKTAIISALSGAVISAVVSAILIFMK